MKSHDILFCNAQLTGPFPPLARAANWGLESSPSDRVLVFFNARRDAKSHVPIAG